MAMELIDEWKARKPAPPSPGSKAKAPSQPVSAPAIAKALAGFQPPILNVLCYEDVGYPWVQVVFDDLIGPDVALRVGDALLAAAGGPYVYFNSLRPKAVYFLLEPAFDPPLDLPASRYGAALAELRKAWSRPARRKTSR